MKVIRYALVGGVAATTDFVIFALFAKALGLNYLWVAAVGFVTATALNYWLSIRFVFKSGARFGFRTEVALVFLVSLIGLAVNQSILYMAIEKLHIEMLTSKILATASVFVWNYGLRNLFVFRPVRKRPVN